MTRKKRLHAASAYHDALLYESLLTDGPGVSALPVYRDVAFLFVEKKRLDLGNLPHFHLQYCTPLENKHDWLDNPPIEDVFPLEIWDFSNVMLVFHGCNWFA